MEYGNYYTEETLRNLNAAYDTLYGITSRETEKVNGIIRRMEKAGRFPPVPQEGDLLEYFPQNGDYFPQAHIETIRKGQATVCLASHAPFCHTKNRKVCYSTEGGPWTRVPSAGMTLAGLATRCFQTWGRNGRCRNGEVYFHTVVRSWTFHEPNPLYGDYTMKEWTKYPVEKFPTRRRKANTFTGVKASPSIPKRSWRNWPDCCKENCSTDCTGGRWYFGDTAWNGYSCRQRNGTRRRERYISPFSEGHRQKYKRTTKDTG